MATPRAGLVPRHSDLYTINSVKRLALTCGYSISALAASASASASSPPRGARKQAHTTLLPRHSQRRTRKTALRRGSHWVQVAVKKRLGMLGGLEMDGEKKYTVKCILRLSLVPLRRYGVRGRGA
jgi:hypothetical protein